MIERSFTAVSKPPRESPAPGEISQRRGWLELPDGALAIAFLLLASSACGALIAVYWPFASGVSDVSMGDRLSTLETKVDEIAAGRVSRSAGEAFSNLRRDLAASKSRLDADEARLAQIEKSEATQENTDLDELKTSADRTSSAVAQLSVRLGKLEQATGPAGSRTLAQLRSDLDDRSQALHDAVTRLGERLSAVERSAPPADFAQKLDGFALRSEEVALETRIQRLESLDMTSVMRRAAAVMALADLIRASAGGDPFADELTALRALAPASRELDDLARYAAKGVATRTTLAESFSQQADSILAADHPAGGGKPLGDRLWSGVMSVVPLRRIGNMIGTDAEARVARAQVDLNLGELARAVREVSALQGASREAAEPWLKSATERLTVDRDARALAQKLVANLSVSPPAQAGAAAGK